MKTATILFTALAVLTFALACSSGNDESTSGTPGSKNKHRLPDEDSPGMTAFRLRMEGRYQEARDTLDYEDLRGKGDLCGLFELARTCFFLNKHDDAYKTIKEVLRLDGKNPRYLFWHSFIAFRLNQARYPKNRSLDRQLTDELIGSLRKALKIDPMYHAARFQLIYVFTRLMPEDGGDVAEAERLARELEETDKGWSVCALGKMIIPGRPWGDIVEKAGKVLEKEPDNLGALLAKTEGILHGGDPLEAEKLIEKILGLDPGWKRLYIALAQTAFRTKEWDRSYKWIDKFLAFPDIVFPERAHASLILARIQKQHNGQEAWEKYLIKACELDPKILSRHSAPPSDINKPPIEE